MSGRLLVQINVSAESQRFPGWALFLVALIVFGMSVPFIRLLILEFQKEYLDAGRICFIFFFIAIFLSLDVWIWVAYKTPQDIQLRLFEDRLEISSANGPIPLTNVEADIGPVNVVTVNSGFVDSVNSGQGLILNIDDSERFLKPGFVDRLYTVYGETKRLRFLIGPMITKAQADSFIEHLRNLKSSAKTSP